SLERLLAEVLSYRGEGPPKRSARMRRVTARPEQLAERVARPRPFAQRQVGNERRGLAGVEGNRLALPPQRRRPEERNLDRGDHRSHRNASWTAPRDPRSPDGGRPIGVCIVGPAALTLPRAAASMAHG